MCREGPPKQKVREVRDLTETNRKGFVEKVPPGLGFEDWVRF